MHVFFSSFTYKNNIVETKLIDGHFSNSEAITVFLHECFTGVCNILATTSHSAFATHEAAIAGFVLLTNGVISPSPASATPMLTTHHRYYNKHASSF